MKVPKLFLIFPFSDPPPPPPPPLFLVLEIIAVKSNRKSWSKATYIHPHWNQVQVNIIYILKKSKPKQLSDFLFIVTNQTYWIFILYACKFDRCVNLNLVDLQKAFW